VIQEELNLSSGYSLILSVWTLPWNVDYGSTGLCWKAARRARLEARNNNKCGKPILVGRKERNVSRDKRKIGKLEEVIQSGRATRVKVDALDKLKKEVDALETAAVKAGTPPEKEARVTRNTPITCRTYGPDRELLE
jgi:hypothetical protein